MNIMQWLILIILIFSLPSSYALEGIKLNIGRVTAQGWNATNIDINLSKLQQIEPQINANIKQFSLDSLKKPLYNIQLKCTNLKSTIKTISCHHSQLQIQDKYLANPQGKLDFSYYPGTQTFTALLKQFKIANGLININFNSKLTDWKTTIKTQNTTIGKLIDYQKHYINIPLPYELDGKGDFTIKTSGNPIPEAIQVAGQVEQLSFYNPDSTQVGENVTAVFDTSLAFTAKTTEIELKSNIQQGEVFFDPIYTPIDKPINIEMQMNLTGTRYKIKNLKYQHQKVVKFNASGDFDLGENFKIHRLKFDMPKTPIPALYQTYLQSWVSALLQRDLVTTGTIDIHVDWGKSDILLQSELLGLNIEDKQKLFGWQGVDGFIQWHNRKKDYSSVLRWKKGYFSKIKLGKSQLYVDVTGQNVKLKAPFRQPILDGALFIDMLKVDNLGQKNMFVELGGSLKPIKLASLSTAFGAPALNGQISGMIPKITYNLANRHIDIDGAILIKAFDGDIVVHKLHLEQPISRLPVLTADIDIKKLNLKTLTNITEFGEMQGELSGYIKSLRMLKWQPVAFDVYLGTPKDNKLPRRISQKAVQNLSNLGNGSAVGMLSQGALSFFENFSYQTIGWGCKLKNSVCEMRGAEKTGEGYYIVKGGGLPRIDVIGYNQKVNWRDLFNRLKNISNIEAPIIR
jgi:hypothetical protein